MELPQRCRISAIMLKIFEGHSQNVDGYGLWKFPSMLGIQPKSMLLQLCLEILTSAAVFAIHRRFHDHSPSLLVRSVRYLHGDIAIRRVHGSILKERVGNVKDLEFASSSRSVRRYEEILGPGKNTFDGHLLWDLVGDWDVLGKMPIIGDIWLNRHALAEIFGLGLQKTEILAINATHSR